MLRVPPEPGADFAQRLFHRRDHGRVLAHAEIVVRAPDGDRLGAVAAEAMRVRETALGPQDVDEYAVAALVVKALDRGFEDAVVVQGFVLSLWRPLAGALANSIANDSQLESFRPRRCRSGRGRPAMASGGRA